MTTEPDIETAGEAPDLLNRHWGTLVGASALLGVASAVLSGGKPPVPVPGEATTLFWVGWGPLMAVGLVAWLAWTARSTTSTRYHAVAVMGIVLMAIYVGLTMGTETGDLAALASAHQLFLCWALVAAALCSSYPNPARQSFAYLVKSVEAVLTGGIFFGAGLIFSGLTFGIFQVMGIELPEDDLQLFAAWAIGALPMLAIGTVYDATKSPLEQDEPGGLTRTLRIITRLLLPLALAVMLIYVLWFIPVYFRKPFEEREVLIVYNATIMAIMVLLTIVVSGPLDQRFAGRTSLFRYAVLGLGALTLILNAYALVAVASRTIDSGLTPNRFAVVGWNVTTLAIMTSVGVRLWIARGTDWMSVFRDSIGRFAPLAAVWAAILLAALPLFR